MRIKINQNYFIYFGLMLLGASGFIFAVTMPVPQGFYAFVAVAGLAGAGVSMYIWYTKKEGRQLICPTGSNCNVVVNSRYSKFMGIKLEYLGILYFGLIFLIYLTLVVALPLFTQTAIWAVLIFTAGAFLMSSYLIFVQGFLLRQWCIWCLLASIISMTIFVISLISLDIAVEFLANISNFISGMHSLGFVLGMGASTAAAFLFFRFLHDFDIDESEMKALQGISDIVWLGIWLALMSQFAFYVVNSEQVLQSGTFLVQTVALLVSAISGAILLIIFAPFLVSVPFKKRIEEDQVPSVLASLRKPIFINGAIALASWYFAFLMDYVPDYGAGTLFILYGVTLIFAITVAIIWQKAVSTGRMV